MTELRLKAIRKQYQDGASRRATRNDFGLGPLDLSIPDGEFFALLGPSGCGKTTLLKLVAGLLEPTSGDLLLDNESLRSTPAEKRGFGMVFQQALLFPHMNVEENIAFGLKMHGVSKRERLQKAKEMLTAVGLDGFGSRHCSALSGGQQQRVSLARALVTKPPLLLMDEPFSALDPEVREEMRELVKTLHRELGTTILFVTHDREEAFFLADRMGVMKDGHLLQVGAPQSIYENPNRADVAGFLGAKNVIAGVVREGKFCSGSLRVELPQLHGDSPGQPGWLVLRPEIFDIVHVQTAVDDDRENPKFHATLHGTVRQSSFRQGFHHMKVAVANHTLDVMHKALADYRPAEGDPITLDYDPRNLRFIPEGK